MDNLKRTPLYDVHLALGAHMTEFAGWEMPLRYSGTIREHRAVRSSCGLFDVSHLGCLRVAGENAEELLQSVATNDISRLTVGRVLYTLFCAEDGGIIDDLLVLRLPSAYLAVVNAANTQVDVAWLRAHANGPVSVSDETDATAILALQGPRSAAVLERHADAQTAALPRFGCASARVAGVETLVARTGYTGEDGFEIYCPAEEAQHLWRRLLSPVRGGTKPLPCGLGARDSLRLEAGLPLYGHEIDRHTNPYEAGLDWAVKLAKPHFAGKEALAAIAGRGLSRRLVGLLMLDRGIPRAGHAVYDDTEFVGRVTSGGFAPTIGKNLAMAYVPTDLSAGGTELAVQIRGRRLRAEVVPLPFYRRPRKPRDSA